MLGKCVDVEFSLRVSWLKRIDGVPERIKKGVKERLRQVLQRMSRQYAVSSAVGCGVSFDSTASEKW